VPSCPAGQKKHTYYGRGYVQLTHLIGYALMGERLGIGERLLHNPELMCDDHAFSYQVMSLGMRLGYFSPNGQRLGQFINDSKVDYVNARLTVNSEDAGTFQSIANRALGFQRLLEASIIPKS
jgi:hypothetical protein